MKKEGGDDKKSRICKWSGEALSIPLNDMAGSEVARFKRLKVGIWCDDDERLICCLQLNKNDDNGDDDDRVNNTNILGALKKAKRFMMGGRRRVDKRGLVNGEEEEWEREGVGEKNWGQPRRKKNGTGKAIVQGQEQQVASG